MVDSHTVMCWELETVGRNRSSFTIVLARSSPSSSTIDKTPSPSLSATVVNSSLNSEKSFPEPNTGHSSSRTFPVDSKDDLLKFKLSTLPLPNLPSSCARWSALLSPSPSLTVKVEQLSSLPLPPNPPLPPSPFDTSTLRTSPPNDTLTTPTAPLKVSLVFKLSADESSPSCLTLNDQSSSLQTRGTRLKTRRHGEEGVLGRLCSKVRGNGSIRKGLCLFVSGVVCYAFLYSMSDLT